MEFGLAAETGFEPRLAVTVAPVTGSGETETDSVTPAVYPSFGESVIVVDGPGATPMGTVTVSGLPFSQKLASTFTSKVVVAVTPFVSVPVTVTV
jgi:hypothetical protein